MRNITILILCTLITFTVNAKNIEGWVYDAKDTSAPLVGVNIYWSGTINGTISNANGYFKLTQQNKNSTLVFSYVGYQTDSILINDKSSLTIYLKTGTDLNEVTITERVNAHSISKINPILTQNISNKELNKFACCNLSESFETNASIDVSYADAVSGIKQIKMLGLSGRYSQLLFENIPIIRGAETAFGLDYIPGTWMESIQVSKGTSAVKNGYESITGQININYQHSENNEKLHYYVYGNQDGKVESNAGITFNLNDKWGTTLLIHGGSNARKLDINNDGFLDKPITYSGNFLNRWNYRSKKVEARFGVSYLTETRKGGQTNFDHSKNQSEQTPYGIGIDVQRLNAFSKIGFLLSRPNTSIGWIASANYFQRESFYGNQTLDVDQYNAYTNLIFQSYIGSSKHTYNTGFSLNYDSNEELFNKNNVGFEELVPGVFFEYNFIPSEQFSLLLGVRNDYSTLHGNFITPRAHLKYSFPAYITLRGSVGKGYRTASIVSENTQFLASSRKFYIEDNTIQEEAWNYGLSMNSEIPIGSKDATLTIELFRTDFKNQLIVDLEQNSNEVHFYNLDGDSYAHSLQIEAFYELFKRFELTTGFRWNNVKATYGSTLKKVPFVSNYKGMISGQYRSNLDKWQFDATLQFHGSQRLPILNNTLSELNDKSSDEYITMIAQVTKNYRNWSFYVGAENLTNFIQENAIIDPENPFGETFDASQIWGPLYGRMFYVGIKYNLDKRF
ncbi:MAG: TonB-dependent receptor [Salinivirgaceae bacterium]|nr:TonB-dependent receptor [Salinivirgaceae bacterium]